MPYNVMNYILASFFVGDNMRILVIGGDRRMLYTCRSLENSGFTVDTLGLYENDSGDISSADVILLPVPVTRDGVNINCALSGKIIPLDIINGSRKNTKVFGGGKLSIDNYTDYLSLDGYALKNAVLTAEGAIAYAVENTDYSLWKSRVLVIGYGRVGKVLTDRLKGFNADLTVSARNERDFAMLDTIGIKHIKTQKIEHNFDIVFNTVDIKHSEVTAKSLAGSLFIDLSSRGGFDIGTAEKYNIRYIKLPSVPAKCAPKTAGEIIAETVIELVTA